MRKLVAALPPIISHRAAERAIHHFVIANLPPAGFYCSPFNP
jgi:hypothetical protein